MTDVTATDSAPHPEPGAASEPLPVPRKVVVAATPQAALDELLEVLDLRDAPDQGEDVFVGVTQPQPWGRVYGGQVLGQSLVAAQRTVDPDRPVHSMHAYFLRPGDPTEPITFAVERLRDGQSFSARRTHALQSGRPILSMIASFQTPAQGLDHQLPMPEGVPDPETLPTLHERYGHLTSEASQRWLRQRPMDLRHVEEPTFVVATGIPSAGGSTRQYVWMRAVGPVPDPDGGPHGPQAAALHAAMLAYASDYSLLEPILRAHGRAFAEPGMRMASLDHAMWWHRPARVDQWLLFVLESPSAQGARGLGAARIYTRDGVLVASVAQEGMIRPPRTEPPPPPPSPSPPLSS